VASFRRENLMRRKEKEGTTILPIKLPDKEFAFGLPNRLDKKAFYSNTRSSRAPLW